MYIECVVLYLGMLFVGVRIIGWKGCLVTCQLFRVWKISYGRFCRRLCLS